MLNRDVIEAIERFAPPILQESWDNTGVQVGFVDDSCRGVLVCFDVTPKVVEEAISLDYNLIISHHPLFFKGIKRLTPDSPQQKSAIDAIIGGITIYSTHTAIDSAEGGVSYILAKLIGIKPECVLDHVGSRLPKDFATGDGQKVGLGVYGTLDSPMESLQFVQHVKRSVGAKMVRTTPLPLPDTKISKVAVCGGAGHEYIPTAIALGAQAYISADLKYHDFVDYQDEILLIDAGHYETEQAVKQTIADEIRRAFPGFNAVRCTSLDDNPVNYI